MRNLVVFDEAAHGALRGGEGGVEHVHVALDVLAHLEIKGGAKRDSHIQINTYIQIYRNSADKMGLSIDPNVRTPTLTPAHARTRCTALSA
jgi:hypothetical protein